MTGKLIGGTKMKNRLRDMARRLAGGKVVRVGFLENATYPDGTPVAAVAAFNNYGTRNAPPRPFFSNMVDEKSPIWPQAVGENLKATDYDAFATLQRMGEGIAGDLRQSIKDTNDPPLAPSTVKRKGFDKPLVDTGHMLQSVDYDVKT